MQLQITRSLLTLLLLIATGLQAASPVWQISHQGNSLYLGGTIHLLRATDYPLPKAFDQAFEQSSTVVFEVDIAQSNSQEFNLQLLQAIRLPAGETLADQLQAATWNQLETFLEKRQIPPAFISQFKPSMAAMTLTLIELKKQGVTDVGVDRHFYDKARMLNKNVVPLETPQQQIDFLADLGQGMEDEIILQTLSDIESLTEQFELMVSSWRSGNQEQIIELFVQPMQQQFRSVYDRLLVERNQAWMPKLESMLQDPETELVLVGSAHLVGEDGLLLQLERAGYQIRQMD